MQTTRATEIVNQTVGWSVDIRCFPKEVAKSNIEDPICQAVLKDALVGLGLVFGQIQLARVVMSWIGFIFACAGNVAVLASVTVWRSTAQIKKHQMVIINMSVANLCFTFFIFPLDGIWQATMVWFGGDFLCRFLNMGKQFAMYIASAIVAVMAIEKVISLLRASSVNEMRAVVVKRMLIAAWMYSLLNSIPASIIFSAFEIGIKHENCSKLSFVQCGDYCLLDKKAKSSYFLYTMCMSFIVPVTIIIGCYCIIIVMLARMSKNTKDERSQLTDKRLRQVRRSWQIVTLLLTASFFICWGPYYFGGIVYYFDESVLDHKIMMLLVISSYFYPCLQPIITLVQIKEVRATLRTRTYGHISSIFRRN